MVQKRQTRTAAPTVQTIPEAEPEPGRDRSAHLLIGVLVFGTVAFLLLAGWTLYQRYHVTSAERLAVDVAAAWDDGSSAGLADVYAPGAILTKADGSKLTGLRAIAVDARTSTFAFTKVGDVSATSDGALVTFAYAYVGHGHGSGVAVLRVSDGKVVRQWNFETGKLPSPPPQGPPSAGGA